MKPIRNASARAYTADPLHYHILDASSAFESSMGVEVVNVTISDVLASAERHYDQGRFLTASKVAESLGPMADWPGLQGRLLAARLARRLGDPRLGNVFRYLSWRENRGVVDAAIGLIEARLARRKYVAAWFFIKEHDELVNLDTDQDVVQWNITKAVVLSLLGDFERATVCLELAADRAPSDPWMWTARSQSYALQDRHDQALEAANHALEIQPWYVPAVQSAAQQLILHSRDDEALVLLTGALEQLECGEVTRQLAELYIDLEQYEEAGKCLAKAQEQLPLLDVDSAAAMVATRAHVAYLAGDLELARELVAGLDPVSREWIGQALDSDMESGKRVVLDVPFVHQHDVTCAPATMAAVCAFWSFDAAHTEIAEEICYDGTPQHLQRRWAEDRGFYVREFTVTWAATVRLIDSGIPYMLSTVGPGMGHMQAVIGYDSRRESLLIRDPTFRRLVERDANELFESQRAHRPNGMVMVPVDRAKDLQAIDLPDTEIYNRIDTLRHALDHHDRHQAQRIVEDLEVVAGDHVAVLNVRRALAYYDSDIYEAAKWTDRLLEVSPNDAGLLFQKLSSLAQLERRAERLALLDEVSRRAETANPAVWMTLANELSRDAHAADAVRSLLRNVFRYQPNNGSAIALLGGMLWKEGQRDRAYDLFRFVACLSGRDEGASSTYFAVAKSMNRTDEALQFLIDRCRRFGNKSSSPAITLANAYQSMGQSQRAFEAIRQASEIRPDDGDLQLSSAFLHAHHSKAEESRQILLKAKGCTRRPHWLRRAAELATLDHSPEAALARWREVLEWEPMAVDAHGEVAALLAQSDGLESALTHLRVACRRFPRCMPLQSLLLQWMKHEGPDQVEAVARHILEFQPVDAQTRGELAVAVAYQGRSREAVTEAQIALSSDPTNSVLLAVVGRLLTNLGDRAAADQHFRQALEIDADQIAAIHGLMSLSASPADALERLQYIAQQFHCQPVDGQGLLAFYQFARETETPLDLLSILREAHAARPNLLQTWQVLIDYLGNNDFREEALALAKEARDLFPLQDEPYITLAQAYNAAGDLVSEVRILEEGLAIAPDNTQMLTMLANCRTQSNQREDAKQLLTTAIERQPTVPALRYAYSQLLWEEGSKDNAFTELVAGVSRHGAESPYWQQLFDWAKQTGDEDKVLVMATQMNPEAGAAFAREVLEGDASSEDVWVSLARSLGSSDQWDECHQALCDGLTAIPTSIQLREFLADLLFDSGHMDEALTACQKRPEEDAAPLPLQVRAAEIRCIHGDSAGGIERLRRIASENPDCVRAWEALAGLWDPDVAPEQGLEIGQNLTRLVSDSSQTWTLLGNAYLAINENVKASDAFRRACTLDPSDEDAGKHLFSLCLQSGDFKDAAEALDGLAPFVPYDYSLMGEVMLALSRGDKKAWSDSFTELCKCQRTDAEAFRETVQDARDVGWSSDARAIMETNIRKEFAGPATIDGWLADTVTVQNWDGCGETIDGEFSEPHVWDGVVEAFLIHLGQSGTECRPFLRRYLDEHRERLRQHNRTWYAAGHALTSSGLYSLAIEWFADWQQRHGVVSSMLTSLTYCYAATGDMRLCAETATQALQLMPDDGTAIHELWLAVLTAIDKDYSKAMEHWRNIDESVMGDSLTYFTMYQMVSCVVRSHEPGAPSMEGIHGDVIGQLRQIHADNPAIETDAALRRLYWLLTYRVAKDRGRYFVAASAWLRARSVPKGDRTS